RALAGVSVLDPACGAGALLVAALGVLRRLGAEPSLFGIDVSELAAGAAEARLALLGARSAVERGDALFLGWPEAELVLSNPPFLRHEALAPSQKAQAARRSGLSRQADLSAHFIALALRHAPDAALVWPRALDTSRSAAPLVEEAAARGGFAYRLRSRVAGSFAASVDTRLAVWSAGHPGRPAAEAGVALAELTPSEILGLARGAGSARLRLLDGGPARRGTARVGDACQIRFGMKTGCNAFFHLLPLGPERFESALCGEISLPAEAARPVLSSLKEAAAPAVATPRFSLFRPLEESARVRAYLACGASAGVPSRPTCAGRSPWWMVAPGRTPAPVLYPAKVGARAFAFVNAAALWEDKKWHALFPREGLEPWLVAAALGATPVRLAIDRAARQLTGRQAIADVDCRVLAGSPFPTVPALRALEGPLLSCFRALERDRVTTDLPAMLARPAQVELDRLVGNALGMGPSEVEAARREMVERVEARLAHALQVREAVARAASALGR
ncbi:MAG TPA: N-6 DNA methylase, partial [Anaeromyxobacteraceae bacterium]|nr:N-6 DNA methylase [Anaeromyxobacteraceae bacterium]